MLGRIFMNRYQATRLLGEGGMGRVYLGQQLDLGRQVVIKVMHDHIAVDDSFRERFQRETLLMAHFQHPYAVTLYDASLADPQGPCIVMEYIKGITLDVLLTKNGRLSPPRVARLLGQICEVLQAAHAQGIIHRDLKPANLMVVDPDTPYEKIKVMDFGLATLLDPGSLKKLTNTNAEFAVGTPGYICPELVRGEDMDHRGDLYSIGVILYELLCGKLPFDGRPSMEVLFAHATEPPPSFAEANPSIRLPRAVEEVVMSCLDKDPARRPQTARALAERFEMALVEERASDQASEAGGPDGQRAAPGLGHSVQPSSLRSVHQPDDDPDAIVHELEAWMPQTIASYKLCGFVQDMGGEVLESVPGRIRVRLGGPGSVYQLGGAGPLSWLGLGRRGDCIDMELHLDQAGDRSNLLRIAVVMRPTRRGVGRHPDWRTCCNQVYCDLRGYLMGKTGATSPVGDAVENVNP
jgi:eukaryotic-like serine/threonine-protein kinase